MKQLFYKNRKWFVYFLYCLCVVVTLLYIRFPSAIFKDYLESEANGMDNSVDLSIHELHLAFPPRIVLTGAKLTLRNDPGSALFDAKSVSIRPEWVSLLSGDRTYHFKAEAYGGRLEGSVSFATGNPAAPCRASLRADHIQVQQVTSLSRLPEVHFKGDFNGDILFQGRFDQMMGGEGEAQLYVSGGNAKLGTPFLGVESIDFDRLTINMHLENRKVRVVQVDLKGNTLQGALSGSISLAGDLLKSRLSLKGNMEPLEGFMSGNQGILQLFRQKTGSMKRAFTIQGTLGAPRFSFT